MALAQIGARLLAGGEAVVDMPPVIGTGLGRVELACSAASIACSTRSTFGQPDWRSRISPPGRT